MTEERAANLLFTEGFMDTNFSFVVPAGTEPKTTLDDFKGLTIAANKGSVYESWLTERAGDYGWEVISFGTQTDAVEAVASGRADANLAGMTGAAWAAKKNPRVDLSVEVDTGLVWALPFRTDDAATRNLIDSVIECLKTDGTMAALSERLGRVQMDVVASRLNPQDVRESHPDGAPARRHPKVGLSRARGRARRVNRGIVR